MRFFFRLQLMNFALMLLSLGLMLALGKIRETHGSLFFIGGAGTLAYHIMVDYDSQAVFIREAFNTQTEPYAYVAGEVYYYDGSTQVTVARDRSIMPILARWNSEEDAILLAYAIGEDAALGWLDEETGELTQLALYEDFDLGFGVVSPDGRYFLLREAGQVRPIPLPKPMLLIDTDTNTVLDFGSPSFAYWSPDSQYLAVGYKEEGRYESRIERYEIATGARLSYPVTISQEDTPFFYGGFASNGVLWAPDSQSMVALNRDTETLYFLNGDGSSSELSVGRITPLRWSPDSRFLLGIGYANGEVGAFIVNASTLSVHRVQSPVVLQEALSDFAWSPDSRYVAVLTHSSGVLIEQRLILYDTEGQMLGNPVEFQSRPYFATIDGTLRWVD